MRDLDIQKRENDLAIGTFGRGIYILDDYTPIREMTKSILEKDAHIFPIKSAKMFFENDAFNKSGQGAEFFRAKNPKFGAVFTYYLKDSFKSLKSIRKKKDKDLKEDDKYEYPTFAELTTEDEEEKGYLVLVISDAAGKVVRRLTAPSAKGMHRINWDLSYSGMEPISQKTKAAKHSGFFVIPGTYKVHLAKYENNEFTDMTDPVDFNVESVMDPTFRTDDMIALNNFRNKLNNLYKAVRGTQRVCSETMTRIKDVENAMLLTPNVPTSKITSLKRLKKELREITKTLNGNSSISKRAANQTPSINGRVTHILYSTAWSNADATGTAKEQYAIISKQFPILLSKLQKIIKVDLVEIERDLDNYKAPWTSGRIPEWKPE
ncbi:MAG: hypothetical protein KAH48_05645, partial [Chlorobi bacterium]|nr:hypothetical protein [Chlorobiota bacterium]